MDRVTIPASFDSDPKYSRYNKSAKGRERRVRENVSRNARSLENYLSRPFVAWDGEGLNEADGSHTYVLLANSLDHSIIDRDGISTINALEMMLDSPDDVTHIIYGGGYDVNMILRDMELDKLRELYKTGTVSWNGYRLEWRGGKSFAVRQGGRKFLLYDVLPFFQRPFVAACDEYLGTDWEYRDEIIREKANRGTFDYSRIAGITDYNRAELRTLVRLANELRERLHKVEIRVSRWDGPGAIASALYKKYGTKSHLAPVPDGVATAGRYAYAGGRFEIIRKGHSESGAYQYDLRSAYPSAIRYLPCLAHGEWRHVQRPTRIARFGVYRVEIVNPPTQSETQPQPLWHRNPNGTVYFTEYPHGWYWSPEAQLAMDLGGAEFHEGWELVSKCGCDPFGFVEALYNKRAALKRAKDGAHVGLKLGLNSLYGKLAQQIGWSQDAQTGELRLPPYHCLEWAGFITSHCRANVYRAAMLAPDDVIAFETDAIFSRVPLPLVIGEGLGEWEETKYSSLTYLKSGMYWGTLADGTPVEKSRGINKGTITRADVVTALRREERTGERLTLPAEQTRFITLGAALNTDMAKWRRWITSPRNISVLLNGKRIDILDREDIWADKGDGWRETQCGFHDGEFSTPYEVAWINPGTLTPPEDVESMYELKLMEAGNDWEYEQ